MTPNPATSEAVVSIRSELDMKDFKTNLQSSANDSECVCSHLEQTLKDSHTDTMHCSKPTLEQAAEFLQDETMTPQTVHTCATQPDKKLRCDDMHQSPASIEKLLCDTSPMWHKHEHLFIDEPSRGFSSNWADPLNRDRAGQRTAAEAYCDARFMLRFALYDNLRVLRTLIQHNQIKLVDQDEMEEIRAHKEDVGMTCISKQGWEQEIELAETIEAELRREDFSRDKLRSILKTLPLVRLWSLTFDL